MSYLHFCYRYIIRCFFAFLLCFTGTATLHAATSGDFTYASTGSAIIVTGYTGAGGAVTIPSTIVGLPVTLIGASAFYQKYSLTSVTIPNSVTSIGDWAFYFCSGLTSLTIGSGVTSIGERAFSYCSGLTSLTIPNSVTSIGNCAFQGCRGLTSLTIPDSVSSIEDCAFESCSGLTSVTIPNSVTTIKSYAFLNCSGLTSVTIGSGVTYIGSSAFENCSRLTSVTIGSGVTYISPSTFSNCSSLTSITIPNSVTYIGGNAFQYCYDLTSVYFQGNAPTAGTSTVFSDTYPTVYYYAGKTGWGSTYAGRPTALTGNYLLQVTGDDTKGSLAAIPSQAYYNAGSTVTVQATPKPGYIFTSWSGASTSTDSSIVLTMNANQSITANFAPDLNYNGDFNHSVANGAATITGYTGAGGAIAIPSSINGYPVTSIGDGAFSNRTDLTSVSIPNNVTSIGNNAFSGCTGLTNVSLPERFLTDIEYIGLTGQVAANALVTGIRNNLGSNNSFITDFTSTVLSKSGNYGLASKSDLTSLASKSDLSTAITPLASKSDLTSLASKAELASNLDALSGNAAFVAALVNNPVFMEALAKQIASGPNNFGISIKQNQTLSFTAIPAQTYAANKKVTLAVTSSAKLTPIVYTSSSTAVATVSGNIVTLKGKGNATITASQAGNSAYNSATSSQVLTVK